MKRSIALLTGLALVILLSTSALGASFADTYGMSPKGMAMGNAMTAHVDDWSSVFYNVAGLGRTAKQWLQEEKPAAVQVFAGYMSTQPQTKLDIPDRFDGDGTYRATNADKDLNYGSIVLGATVDVNMWYDMESIPPHMLSSCRWGIAVGVTDDLGVAKVNDVQPQTHNYLRFGRESQQLTVIQGLGLGFMDDLVGVGFGTRSSFGGEGRVLLNEVEFTTTPERPQQQTYMDLQLETAFTAGLYVDLDTIDIGFSWRQETEMKIDPFQNAAITSVGDIPLNLIISIFDYYQPPSYTGGVSYQINERLMLALDVEYQEWSRFDVSTNQRTNWGAIIPDLDDIWIPKVGMQYNFNEKTSLYLGYYYQPSFIPNDGVTGAVNWLDNDKHVGSIGVSYDVGKFLGFKVPVAVHGSYQCQYLVDREVVKAGLPDSLNPSYSYGGMVHTIMVGFSL